MANGASTISLLNDDNASIHDKGVHQDNISAFNNVLDISPLITRNKTRLQNGDVHITELPTGMT